ncbi:MAG: peptide chain release factor-like protein [Verrucomicrobia bacterium]|nr:MAG: peptide chain release factor-like protein [Verrucomicrobiota bacterium]
MSAGAVGPDRWEAVVRRMAALGIAEADLEERFVRSSGPGGQRLNKVATCVLLRHRPTGIEVRCQATRHQGRNRLLAREWLCDKIEALQARRKAERRAAAEKRRRQLRRPGRAAQERRLAAKRRRSRLKELRRRVGDE